MIRWQRCVSLTAKHENKKILFIFNSSTVPGRFSFSEFKKGHFKIMKNGTYRERKHMLISKNMTVHICFVEDVADEKRIDLQKH